MRKKKRQRKRGRKKEEEVLSESLGDFYQAAFRYRNQGYHRNKNEV